MFSCCSFSIPHGRCAVALAAQHSTNGTLLNPRLRPSEGQKRAALESSLLPPQAAAPLRSGSEVLSQAIVLWAVLEGKSQWGDMAAPEQGPPGPAGSPQGRAGLCVAQARGSPHGPAPKECAACLDISFQFTAATLGRGELQCRRKVTSPAFLWVAVLR